MSHWRSTILLLSILVLPASALAQAPSEPEASMTTAELIQLIAREHELDEAQVRDLQEVFAGSRYIGTGNPDVTRHPATPAQCRQKLAQAGVRYENPRFEQICGARYMAPLYDPATQEPEDATACIDMFEFPDIPCAYPVVWVRAAEAARICSAMGRRLCDAHEWEGACAGALQPPGYPFELAAGVDSGTAFNRMRAAHNRVWDSRKTWAYGSQYRSGICATGSRKSQQCDGGGWSRCGSNTFPAGMFPECRSPLGVYDQHGNAAEHMNLPLDESQMASRGSTELGLTEMKGSWFIWDSFRAHEDACRWRAPYWHGSRVMSPDSHHNYHLSFRCCKSVDPDS